MKSKKIPEEQKNPRERMYTKPKAGSSFSIPNRRQSFTRMARQHPSQEKTWRKETVFQTDENSSTSTSSKVSTSVEGEDESETVEIAIASYSDDDEWETETSVEMMRSAELTSVDDSVIPPPESFRDKDIASLAFLSESYCPIAYSTPRFISNGKSFPFSVNLDSLKEAVPYASSTMKSDVVKRHEELPTIPNVSFENEFAKEKDTLEGEDIEMKSISPEQSVQLPVVPDNVSYRNQEQSEGRLESDETEDILSPFKKRDDGECKDSIIFPEVPFPAVSDNSQESDASTVPCHKEDEISSPVKKRDDAERREEDSLSKPITPEKNLVLPDFADGIIQETQQQREGEDIGMKSISPQQSVQLPVVPDNVNYKNQEQSEGRLESEETEDLILSPFRKRDDGESRDSIIFPEVPFSAVFEISQDSDASTLPCNKEDQISPVEECDGAERRDSIADLEVSYSGGSAISQPSDVSTVGNFDQDQEDSENKNLEAVVNKSTNSNFRKQRQEDEAGDSFEDNNEYSNGEDFGKFRNLKIDSSKEKWKGYKVKNRMNESITRWKQRNEGVNFLEYKSDSEDNIENVQEIHATELEDNELFNNQPQTVAPQVSVGDDKKRQQEKGTSFLSRSQNSISLRKKHTHDGKYLFEDENKNDSQDSSENVQNKNFHDYELVKNQLKTNKRVKFAGILSRSKNSNRKRKNVNKITSSSEDEDNYKRLDNFEKDETPKRKGVLCKRSKLKFSKCKKTPRRKKYRNEGGNFLKDTGMNDSSGIFETDQNEQNELQDIELDNNGPGTSTYRTNKKINKYIGADKTAQKEANVINRSPSSPSIKKKYKNEEQNCFEDMGMTVTEDNFEHFQNEPHEELHQDDESDYNVPEISAHLIKRSNIHVESDNMKQQNASISNKPLSVHRRRKHENEGENSLGDPDKSSEDIQENRNDGEKIVNSFEEAHDGVDDFEEVHTAKKNTSKKKRKRRRNRHYTRSRKAAKSMNRSRNSTSREVSVGPQNRMNEAENSNWPRCCLEAQSYSGRTFRVLSPVFRDDYPIDSITLLCYDLKGSKKNCKH